MGFFKLLLIPLVVTVSYVRGDNFQTSLHQSFTMQTQADPPESLSLEVYKTPHAYAYFVISSRNGGVLERKPVTAKTFQKWRASFRLYLRTENQTCAHPFEWTTFEAGRTFTYTFCPSHMPSTQSKGLDKISREVIGYLREEPAERP